MKEYLRFRLSGLVWALIVLAAFGVVAFAQTGQTDGSRPARRHGALQPQSGTTVTGTGTPGQITKWTGAFGTLGDSVITEDKYGKIGIGTTTPNSKLAVNGMIETTLGGYKFPDGTVQATAAVAGLQSIFHDATLTGNGTQGSPLGITVPLTLSGSSVFAILNVANVPGAQSGGPAISATGGDFGDNFSDPGAGIRAVGGNNTDEVDANTNGGVGVDALGGDALLGKGGAGIWANGGKGYYVGGSGLEAWGGGPLDPNAGALGGTGVEALGGTGAGMNSVGGDGIFAKAGDGVNGALPGRAAYFDGAVEISGNFSVTGGGTKNFKIDHPLDPEKKYLYHAAIESSEVLNIYSGNVTTDESGDAVVSLPDWFEAINRDYRYQLTVVSAFAQAIVAEEINGNRFKIKTSAPSVKVSWQVTGVRSDPAMLRHPFRAEEDKPELERGYYLAPEAYDQPQERSVEWARSPQRMQQLNQQRAAGTVAPGQKKHAHR